MILRRANLDDALAIAELHAHSWRTFYRGSLSDQYLDSDVVEERRGVWASRLSTENLGQLVMLAEADGRLLGFACAYLDADPTWGALLDNLHVAASEHRRGVGSALIRSVISWVQENRETSGLHLWLLQSNASARAFYEAQGGQIVGTDLWEPPGGSPKVPRFRVAWPAASQMRSNTSLERTRAG